MIRANGQESVAVVTHQWCDVQNGMGELNLELDAPVSEASLWIHGQRLHIEARWNPTSITFPPHDGLAKILMSSSVQGSFMVEDIQSVEEGRLAVRLTSTGRLQPLEPLR